LDIPAQITIVDSSFFLDGGTVALHAITDDGLKCSIQLNQRVFSDFYADPGRLFFNGERIDVRSDKESQIVRLLKTASIESVIKEPPPNSSPPISKNALILGDDIRQFFESSPQSNLERFRNQIVEFIESDEYVRIATCGLP